MFSFSACGDNKPPEEPGNPTPPPTVSKWDGTIPGWQAPYLTDEQIIANRPSTYVVDEANKVVTLNDANAFVWFAYRSVIGKTGFAGYTVKLNCDIDLDNHMWIPIGLGARSNSPRTAFQGTFDGQNHTIYNLSSADFMSHIKYGTYKVDTVNGKVDSENPGFYLAYSNGTVSADIPININDEGEFTYGLFGTTKNATIKNLKIEGVKIDVSKTTIAGAPYAIIGDSVGAIVGFARGETTIENCVAGKAGHDSTIGYIRGGTCEGGVVGRVYAGTDFTDSACTSTRDELGKNQPFNPIKIENCVNNLDITVGDIKAEKTGGIVGYTQFFTTLNVKGCTNNGSIHGNGYTGGIVGYRAGVENKSTGGYNNGPYGYDETYKVSNAVFENCVNNGLIESTESVTKPGAQHVGGIVGYRTAGTTNSESTFEFKNCVNNGKIEVSANTKVVYVGGIAGYIKIVGAAGKIVGCENKGEITIDTGTNTAYVSAINGYLDVSTATVGSLTIENCNNTAKIQTVNETTITSNTGTDLALCVGYVKGTISEKLITNNDSFTNTGVVENVTK